MLRRLITNPYVYVMLLTYYGIWLIWDSIVLPFHNPEGIISFLPQIGYNPTNNIVRILLAVLFPPLACLAFWLMLNNRLGSRLTKLVNNKGLIKTLVISGSILLCISMGIVQNSTNPANNPKGAYGGPYSYAQLDTFHEGETLGPAISYQDKDLKPYRDFVIVHGVFQDPLRSVIAFKLFGQSIGATRAFAVILGIITFLSYLVLLLVLFRGNPYRSAFALSALAILILPMSTLPILGNYIYGVQFPFRDIATILFLIAAITGYRAIVSGSARKTAVTSLIIGFIVTVGFANSIDRAFYIAALSVIWLIMAAIMDTSRLFLKSALLPYLIGVVLGIPILGLALKWAFRDFAAYLFTISRYKEYLDGIIFARPNFAVSLILLIIAACITISGGYVLEVVAKNGHKITGSNGVRAWLSELRLVLQPIIRKHCVSILLFITALVFLRSAVGRALPDHFIYSVQWLYLFLAYVGISYAFRGSAQRRQLLNLFAVLLLGIFAAFYTVQVRLIDTAKDSFPIHIRDEEFMRTDHIETAEYLKKNLRGGEKFVTFTSEAAWYYFANKPSPIKYPVIWYAFTKTERQSIADDLAKKKDIKYVVLNNNWTTNFDYVPNEVRFPEAYAVLKRDFVPYKGFGQQTLWIRK